MKIAQIAPLFERVPPLAYGGTERVISSLTEELIRQGHEVTLFAAGDAVTGAQLIAPIAQAMRAEADGHPWLAHATIQMDQVAEMASEFDILHFHTDFLHFPLARRCRWPHLTTMHGRLDLPQLGALFRRFPELPLVSISQSQRTPLPWVNWVANVAHGVPAPALTSLVAAENYFAFVGRISPEKRVDRAIAIAEQCNTPLIIAAKVDPVDMPYFEHSIRPLIKGPLISFIGEVDEQQKRSLLMRARALLFPIDWPEPFGLVMIEALSCGTPVIAFRNGSVAEVIEHGKSGFIVETLDEAVAAARKIDQLDRSMCRAIFDRRFTVDRMAHNYVATYKALLNQDTAAASRASLASSSSETAAW